MTEDAWSEPLSVVDDPDADADAGAGGDAAGAEKKPHACPHCDASYSSASGLRAHIFRKHRGEAAPASSGGDAAPRRGRRAASSGTRQERRRKMVRETIDELTSLGVELRRGTGIDPENLGDVLRRDADRIATSLSWIAERVNPLGRFIDLTMGHGGAISIARGFNGVGLWFLRTWRKALAERAQERADAQDVIYLGPNDEEPHYGEPPDAAGTVDGDGSAGPLG